MDATPRTLPLDAALTSVGINSFHYRLLAIFGLVWMADAMQVLAIGIAGPSIARSFGLSADVAIRDSGTAFFVGMILGAWGFGQLADRFGRRRVLIVTVTMDAICGLAAAAAPDYGLLLLFRALTGMAVGGTLPIDCSLFAEFLPPRRRGRWLMTLEAFWTLGTGVIAAAAWAISHNAELPLWRQLFVITSVPALLGVGLRFWVPESPYHLARLGRLDAARDVLARIARGRPLGFDRLTADELDGVGGPRLAFPDLFGRGLRRRTLLVMIIWFAVSAAYYGVAIWLPGWLAGSEEGLGFVRQDGFLALVLAMQVPALVIAGAGLESTWGRRRTLTLFLVGAAVGCTLFVLAETPVVVGAGLLLMSFALAGSWGGIYTYTPELYPTALRATGMGMAGAMARVGGVMAPSLVALLVEVSFGLAIGLFAALLLLAAVATLLIPEETRRKGLD